MQLTLCSDFASRSACLSPAYKLADLLTHRLTHAHACVRKRKKERHTHKGKEIKLKKLEPSARNASRNFCDSVQGFVNSLSSMLNNKRGGGVREKSCQTGRVRRAEIERQEVAEVAEVARESRIYDMCI